MESMNNKYQARLNALKAELIIREKTRNQSERGYQKVVSMIQKLEKKIGQSTSRS